MPRNYKFHAIALSAICFVIILLYVVMNPKPPIPPADNGNNDRFIQIDSATWGEACNPFITKTMREQAFRPAQRDANGDIVEQKQLELISANNVLPLISATCDTKMKCDIVATSKALGIEPLTSCFKHLKVAYRCFSYDRLWNLDAGQGETMHISCDETAKPAAK